MFDKPVRVIAHFSVREDMIDEFIAVAAEKLIRPSRAEPGCVQYDLCQDLADPCKFAMVENWGSEEKLAVHLAQDSLKAVVAELISMVEGPPKVLRFRALVDS